MWETFGTIFTINGAYVDIHHEKSNTVIVIKGETETKVRSVAERVIRCLNREVPKPA